MKKFNLENETKITPGFVTPEDYFESFSASFLKQLPKEEVKVISFYKRKKLILYSIAAVLVVGLLIPIIINFRSQKNELDSKSIETYLAYQSGVNQYDLISQLEIEDIDKMDSNYNLDPDAVEEILSTHSDLDNLLNE